MESLNMTKYGLLHWEYENPPLVEPYWFEKIDGNELRLFTKRSLPPVSVICGLYFLFVWLGPKWMKNRKPYDLQRPLVYWNFFFSLFSLAVVVRITPEIIQKLMQPDGYYKSVCDKDGLHYSTTFWVFLYGASKILELGDTVFIVLRKKPLIMLHWFHHFNMVWSPFFVFIEGEPSTLRYVVVVNSFVHTLMYAYYGFRALHIKVPNSVAMTITASQITQFIIGFVVQYHQLYSYPHLGKPCFRTNVSLAVTTIFGSSYLYLFSHLFYKSYIRPPSTGPKIYMCKSE